MDNKDFNREDDLIPLEPLPAGEDSAEEASRVFEALVFQPGPDVSYLIRDIPMASTPEEPASEPDASEEDGPAGEDIFQGLPLFQELDSASVSDDVEIPVILPEPGFEESGLPEVPEDELPELYEPPESPAEEQPETDAAPENEVPQEPSSSLSPEAADAPEPESMEEPLPEPPAEEEADQEYRDNSGDFGAIFEAAPQKPQPQAHQRPARKGRPQRKKGEGLLGIPNILATFVWLALILAIGVTAGRMLWVCAADVLAFGREDKPVTVTIYEADDMASITDKLYNAGLIRYKSLFNLYASISNAEEDIQPGIYDLNTLYDYHALVNFMSPRSSREVIELTIPEGYTCQQIFALLEENRVCTAVDAANYAANGELNDYWFLEGLERGTENCLEGYLFPDTYEFYKNSTPREALQRMLNNFEIKFTEEMRGQIDTLNANVTGGGYTIREVTIVASLIEKESAGRDESDEIAGVIYNRLFRWDGIPAYLNIDASIVYAQGGDAEHIDTSLDSPYNTYLNIGLTPGPIANPGLSSLQAALNPANHNYYYYVLNPATGVHQLSTTQEEHNSYIAQFYND